MVDRVHILIGCSIPATSIPAIITSDFTPCSRHPVADFSRLAFVSVARLYMVVVVIAIADFVASSSPLVHARISAVMPKVRLVSI